MDLDVHDALGSDKCKSSVCPFWQCGSRTGENNWATCKGAALPPPLRSVIPFLCGEYLCWVSTMTACVHFSTVLILVVKILGGGGTSSGLWKALVLETTFPSQKTS